MLYRKFGKTGIEVSNLGFGCMRLPVQDGEQNKIDKVEATKLLRYAIDHGVNYVDTAYIYHGGMSEPFVGEALSDGYRDKVYLATKLPSWLVKSREDMDKYLNEQLERLQTDHIDFYLIHGLNRMFWDNLLKHKLFDFIESVKKDGKVRNIGFSFHDQLPLFKEIVDAYDWSFCQIQYNFMDEEYQAGLEGLNYAAGKGMAIVVMEPLRGGKLAKGIPDDVQKVWDAAETKRSPAEWALRFVWDNPAVSTVLSGMNTIEQLRENIAIASQVTPNSLTVADKETIHKACEIYKTRIKINCTNCKYCLPCPAGVNIPTHFNLLNDAHMYDDVRSARMGYAMSTMTGGKASKCTECGACEGACPQQLPIREHLKEVVAKLEA